ncbi:MAG: hypothetical protein ACON38_01260 [Akkermansiaceae bacterium]
MNSPKLTFAIVTAGSILATLIHLSLSLLESGKHPQLIGTAVMAIGLSILSIFNRPRSENEKRDISVMLIAAMNISAVWLSFL